MSTTGKAADPESVQTQRLLTRFNQAFLDHDASVLEDLVAEDCVIENTQPAPDGSRHEGKAACLRLWSGIAANTGVAFETESITARGDRGEIRWRLRWGPSHQDTVRGVNLMRVRDGRIVEASGYVKGG